MYCKGVRSLVVKRRGFDTNDNDAKEADMGGEWAREEGVMEPWNRDPVETTI